MAQITLRKFSLDEALNGATIGWANNGKMTNGLYKVAYNFIADNSGYKYTVDGQYYYCNKAGVPVDGDSNKQLFMVNAKLEETKGTVASRVENGEYEEIHIDALQPREQFAMHAMRSIISSIADPLHCDAYTVKAVAEKSFEFAQAMMTKAAEVRAATQTSETEEKLEIDAANLTSVTEKILYNMQLSLDEFKKCIKEEKIQLTIDELKKCLKDEKLSIEVKNEKVPVELKSVVGEVPIKGTVSVGNSVDVNVINTVEVMMKEVPEEVPEETPEENPDEVPGA